MKYHPARDHDKGPGAWCIRGPKDFYICMDTYKLLAYEIAHYLNGNYSQAKKMNKQRIASAKHIRELPPVKPPTGDLVAKMYEKMKNV